MTRTEYFAAYQRRRRARFKRAGLCMDCGRKARPGKTYCRKHFKQHVDYARERAAENRRKGLSAPERKKALASLNIFDGRCPICGRKAKRPCVDHKGKKFRGIICSRCNVGLGCARDSIRVLKSMIRYLRGNR